MLHTIHVREASTHPHIVHDMSRNSETPPNLRTSWGQGGWNFAAAWWHNCRNCKEARTFSCSLSVQTLCKWQGCSHQCSQRLTSRRFQFCLCNFRSSMSDSRCSRASSKGITPCCFGTCWVEMILTPGLTNQNLGILTTELYIPTDAYYHDKL